jgi:dihydroorotate dehydrogenase
LRDLQEKKPLTALLQSLHTENLKRENPKPILLKIAPDMTDTQLFDIINIVSDTKIDGVIATNTSIARNGLQSDSAICAEKGGLSGKPISDRSTYVIRFLHTNSKGSFPIIGVGGIHTPQDAIDKLEAGASLLQIYTGFVYEGPGMVKRILKAL